jgi:hypothetical protein
MTSNIANEFTNRIIVDWSHDVYWLTNLWLCRHQI